MVRVSVSQSFASFYYYVSRSDMLALTSATAGQKPRGYAVNHSKQGGAEQKQKLEATGDFISVGITWLDCDSHVSAQSLAPNPAAVAANASAEAALRSVMEKISEISVSLDVSGQHACFY